MMEQASQRRAAAATPCCSDRKRRRPVGVLPLLHEAGVQIHLGPAPSCSSRSWPNTVCEVCGDIGFKHLLVCCRDCKCSAAHQYCWDKVVFDASLADWLCYECLQRRGEVTCSRSLEKVSSERPPSHTQFGSTVHQPITKRVESARDAGPWRNRKIKSYMTKYASLNKVHSSRMKRTKKKSNMRPMGNCTNRKGRIASSTAHACVKALHSCETIGTETAKSNNGENQLVDNVALNTKQPSPLIVNCLGYTLGDTDQSRKAMEGLARKSKKAPQSLISPFKGLIMKTKNVVLGSKKLESSSPTAEHGNSVFEKSADRSNSMKDSGANLSPKHTDHDNQTNQHASVGCKNTKVMSVKDNKTVVGAHQNKYWAAASLRNNNDKYEAHGHSNSNFIDGLTLEREKEEVRFQLDYRASNELSRRSMAANVPQPSTLHNDAVDKGMPYSPSSGCEKVFSDAGIRNAPDIRERSVDSVDISSICQHDTTESSENSERFAECQKGSSCHRRKTVKMATTSFSSEESGEDIPCENGSLESDDLQASPWADYVLSYKSYLSQAQKERVMAFIQETQPEITVFVAIMRKSNVHPPGPYLAISKEYAFAHFPHKSTNVTLQRPGKSKKWHPIFYKRNESRKNMLIGQWLDFVHDNRVQEGDICLLLPTKDGRRSTFTVYLLRATATHSSDGTGFRSVSPCATATHSSAKTASEVHIKEEPKPTDGEHVSSDMKETFHESLERDFGGPSELYIVACRSHLSQSQIIIVEERVEAIQSEFPIYVAVMKNNNAGVAQRWMLELGVRYAAAIHLPACGQTVVLHCMGKTWETQMVIHNGRRWFLNGGWTKFARDNGLRVGDICLFELKKESKLTMAVHIISREQC